MKQYDDEGNCRDCGTPKGTEHKGWCHLELLRRTREEAWAEGANRGFDSQAPEDIEDVLRDNPHKPEV